MRGGVLKKAGQTLIGHVEIAESARERMVGLLGRSGIEPGHAMYLSPCPSIHTFFMQFPLDVVFVDRDMSIVRLVDNVPPGRIVAGGFGAAGCIEMAAGGLAGLDLRAGDELVLESAD